MWFCVFSIGSEEARSKRSKALLFFVFLGLIFSFLYQRQFAAGYFLYPDGHGKNYERSADWSLSFIG